MLSSLELRGRYDPALVFEWIRDRRVDGLILAKSQRRERPLLRAAVDVQLPTVVVAPDEITTDVQVVRCNNIAGGEAVAAHLAALGHRRIAFAGLPEHSIDSRHRLRGLRSGLQARGIQLEARDVYTCASFTSEAGGRFAERFFERPLDVTALVLATDALAFGVMRVALQRGVRMPEDLSIVGFDGLPQGALFHPALTSVSQPMRDMGRVACSRLFDTLGGRMELTEFPMELVERESTAPAAGGHARKEMHLVVPPDRGAAAGPSGDGE
jgi:LacI family transcriptional regulator